MVHHIFGRAAEGDLEANINNQSQNNINAHMPNSAAQSTFSLTTPTTADHLPHTPFNVSADLPSGPDGDVDVARAAAIPLPPDGEDEFEDAEQRYVHIEMTICPNSILSPTRVNLSLSTILILLF
jgi:hypothetical protein